tara:strand:+ start:1587 stop:2360 length:774 start_codon:yes stop_codon:yes gene_type:complete
MNPKEGIAWANGRELEFHRYTAANDGLPPIVMLHEGLGSVTTWREFPAALAERTGAEVIIYSRYGYGFSTRRREPFGVDYMHKAALEELPVFLDAVKIEKPVLFGHSDGASIALIYAGTRSDDVTKLIIEAPHVFTEQISVDSIAAIREVYNESEQLKNRLARHHADPDTTFRGWNDAWQLPDFIDWNIEKYLPEINCPTLVIQGLNDEYGTLEQVDRIENGVGGICERLVLGECGHAPHREKAEAVLSAVGNFLRR